jgi:hypothetical protein
MQLFVSNKRKALRSPTYNYNFDKRTGYFARWGKTHDDDPQFSPYGPEILDLEISVNGCPNGCRFCYKSNTPAPATNMTLETFKEVLGKFPPTLTQIALGITGIQTNPDFPAMLRYAREQGIIPNFTLSGIDLTDEIAREVAPLVGGVAVSVYQTDKNVGYNAIEKFVSLGVEQVNIHILVSEQTIDFVHEVLEDRLVDPRMQGMKAILFLGVKPKGRGVSYDALPMPGYVDLINTCLDKKIAFGFDSCSAARFERFVQQADLSDEVKSVMMEEAEGCESSCFSAYVNVHGVYWHCSFIEEVEPIEIDLMKTDNFLRDVWYNERVIDFRNRVIGDGSTTCRQCPVFEEIRLP